MRKETNTMKRIRMLYYNQNLDTDKVLHKSKLLLSVYRDVVWSATIKAEELRMEAECQFNNDLDAALTYLSSFAPDEQRQELELRVIGLFETKWLIELIESSLVKVRDYPNSGKLYFDILSNCYTNVFRSTESDTLELLNMERSIYYDRKREAVMLFGVVLWGYAIPEMKAVFDENYVMKGYL